MGPAADRSSDMGPLVAQQHLGRVRGYVDEAEAEGARIVVDGRTLRMDRQGYEHGCDVGATLIDEVTPEMTIWKEEVFGLVLSVVRCKDYDEAVGLIRRHHYASGVAIFTRNNDAARSFAQEVEVGMVGVNVPIAVPTAFHSFGGWKPLLFGGPRIHGQEGVRLDTRLKAITTRWPTGLRSDPEFVPRVRHANHGVKGAAPWLKPHRSGRPPNAGASGIAPGGAPFSARGRAALAARAMAEGARIAIATFVAPRGPLLGWPNGLRRRRSSCLGPCCERRGFGCRVVRDEVVLRAGATVQPRLLAVR